MWSKLLFFGGGGGGREPAYRASVFGDGESLGEKDAGWMVMQMVIV